MTDSLKAKAEALAQHTENFVCWHVLQGHQSGCSGHVGTWCAACTAHALAAALCRVQAETWEAAAQECDKAIRRYLADVQAGEYGDEEDGSGYPPYHMNLVREALRARAVQSPEAK